MKIEKQKLELTGYMVAQIKRLLEDATNEEEAKAIRKIMYILKLDPYEDERYK